MLAENLFVVTLALLLVVGVVAWYAARPYLRRLNEDCERNDAAEAAQRADEAKERALESRLRSQAVKEVEADFPTLHEDQGSNEKS